MKKGRNLRGKKTVFTAVHIIAVVFLVLSLCGMIYAVDAAGGNIYEIFRETNASANPEGTKKENNKETQAENESIDKKETEKETKTTLTPLYKQSGSD